MSPKQPSVGDTITIEFNTATTVGHIEECLEIYQKKYPKLTDAQQLSFSLAYTGFIDTPAAVFLTAITYTRWKAGKSTTFQLPAKDNPAKKKVLSFLYNWRFFFVLEEITEIPLMEFIENPESLDGLILIVPQKEDHDNEISREEGQKKKYSVALKETETLQRFSKDYFAEIYENNPALQLLHDKGFFPLVSNPFKTPLQQETTLINRMTEWNKDSLIVSILQRVLSEAYANKIEKMGWHGDIDMPLIQNSLADNVIKECITNCIRHPKADLLITTSFFDLKEKIFTLVIWDNGKSIVESLRNGLQQFGTIKTQTNGTRQYGLSPSYFKTSGDENSKDLDRIDFDSKLFFTDKLPNEDSPDWHFLLASIFPGVTSKPLASGENQSKNGTDPDRAGIGLTVLLDEVIKGLDGHVTIRIDNQVMKIKRIERQFLMSLYRQKKNSLHIQPLQNRYIKDKIIFNTLPKTNFVFQVKIDDKSHLPLFKGNMLTLKIPLK